MVKVTYVEYSGTHKTIDVPEGWSLMQGAAANGIASIEAECGGSCACATCHVYVEESWLPKLAPALANETDMLDSVAAELRATSRLSCQIKVSSALDGIIVHIPESQG